MPDSHVVLCSPLGPCSSAPLSVRGFLSAPQDGRQPHHPGRSPASLASARWAPGQLGRLMPPHGSGRWGAPGSVCGAGCWELSTWNSARFTGGTRQTRGERKSRLRRWRSRKHASLGPGLCLAHTPSWPPAPCLAQSQPNKRLWKVFVSRWSRGLITPHPSSFHVAGLRAGSKA